MRDWRTQYLGLTTFPITLTAAEIDEIFTLGDDIPRVVRARRTPLTRLGLVLQIGFLRLTGRSLNSVQVIPPAVLARAGQRPDANVVPVQLRSQLGNRRR